VARTAVVAGTATAVSNRVSRRQEGRWAAQEQQAQDQQQQPQQYQQQQYQQQQYQQQQYQQQQAAPGNGGDPMAAKLDQLKSLGDLKAQGVLTDAEFERQKQAILNS